MGELYTPTQQSNRPIGGPNVGLLSHAAEHALLGFTAVILSTAAADAAANAIAIQAALDAKGTVSIKTPGTYPIDGDIYGVLKIGSDTTLELGAGVTLQGPSAGTSVAKPLLVNKNWRANRSTITAITSTYSQPFTTTTVNETAHGRAVGDAVLIKGDTTKVYNGVWRVFSVTDANNWTFRWSGYGAAPANGAGTMLAYSANANFAVVGDGKIDFNYNNNNQAPLSNVSKHAVIFNKVADWEWSMRAENAVKYGMTFENSYRGYIHAYPLNNSSDGIHGQGPVYGTRIRAMAGVGTGDDMIAFTANQTGFTQYNLLDADGSYSGDGDIEDTDIDMMQGTWGGSRTILMQGGQGCVVRRTTIRGIKHVNPKGGLYILFDVLGTETTDFEDTLIDGFQGNFGSGIPMVSLGTLAGTTLNFKGLTLQNMGSHGGQTGTTTGLSAAILSGTNATINIDGLKLLNVDVDVDLANAPANFSLIEMGLGSGVHTLKNTQLDNVVIRQPVASATRSCKPIRLATNAQFDVLQGSNVNVRCNNSCLADISSTQADMASGPGVVQFTNSFCGGDGTNNGQSLITTAGARNLDIMLSNVQGKNQVNGGLYITAGSAKTYNVRMSNVRASHRVIVNNGTSHTFNVFANAVSSDNNTVASGNMITVGTTSTWNFKGWCGDIGIDLSTVARQDGTVLYNTNTALGTLAVAALVVGQGVAANSWHRMDTPTLVY